MKVIARGNSSAAEDATQSPVVVELRMSLEEAKAQAHRRPRVEEVISEALEESLRNGTPRRIVRNVES